MQEAVVADLQPDELKLAYRLGRSNKCLIGEDLEYNGIPMQFSLFTTDGKPLYSDFTCRLT